MNTTILIDTENRFLKCIPSFLQDLFLKTYREDGIVQFDTRTKKPAICGDSFRVLAKLEVKTTSQKRAYKLMFQYLCQHYPQYKEFVQLF